MKSKAPYVRIGFLCLFILSCLVVRSTLAKAQNEKTVRITISAIGDCTLGIDDSQKKLANFNKEYVKQKDDAYFFKKVYAIFFNDDLTLANLEGTLTTSTNRQEKRFAFKGSPSYVEILKAGGIDAVNLANNHTYDYGWKGYKETLQVLTDANIEMTGLTAPTILTIKGVRLGLIGIKTLPLTEAQTKSEIKRQIKLCQEEETDLIIVSFHWGIEHTYQPEKKQQRIAHYAIDLGADLILGHHPHVLQGVESYKDKMIVYSLGNFCFGGNTNPSDKDTMIYRQTFVFENGSLSKASSRIIPCSLSSVSTRNNYQPTLLSGKKRARVIHLLNERSQTFQTKVLSSGAIEVE